MASEKISILLMKDNGESRRYRIRRSCFRYGMLIFFLVFPLTAGSLAWLYYDSWTKNKALTVQITALEELYAHASLTVQRLENMEALLHIDTDTSAHIRDNFSRDNSKGVLSATEQDNATTQTQQQNDSHTDDNDTAQQDGPGHADFPEINTGEITVESVNSRLITANRLRTSFDIRNPGTETLSGNVTCILSLADGRTVALKFIPANAGYYRIQRWKRAVLVSEINTQLDMINSQVIVEIHNEEKKLLYRNIFPIEQK